MAEENRTAKTRPDFATLGGVVFVTMGIVGGLILEGGELGDIGQVTAALIVGGGTLGAVMIGTPLSLLSNAVRRLVAVLLEHGSPRGAVAEEIVGFATRARRNGIVSLEQDAEAIEDPFLRKALMLALDGTDIQDLRAMMELEIAQQSNKAEAEAGVFESAGGYAPTIGIIGAVMGLIQVMKNLADIDKVGHGIAMSFVATVYGVGLANVVLLPVAHKIKIRAQERAQTCEMMVEGIVGIVEGLNPKLIRSKLEAYLPPGADAQAKPAAAEPRSSEA
jgi:chemotaxis protein MotA